MPKLSKNNSKINLTKNIFFSTTGRFISMFMGFVLSVFITRFLGPDLKGKYAFFLANTAMVWKILDFGLHKSFPYSLQKNPSEKNTLFSFFNVSILLEVLLLSSLFLIFKNHLHEYSGFESVYYFLIFIVWVITVKMTFSLKMYLLGVDRVFWQVLLLNLPIVTHLIIFFSFRNFIPDEYRLLFVLSSMLSGIIIWAIVFNIKLKMAESLRFELDKSTIFKNYKLGFRAFLSGFVIFLLIKFDIILIKKYEPFTQLGIYSLAANFVNLIQTFFNLTGSLMLPKFSGSKSDKDNIITLKRVSMFFFAIIFFITIVFFVFGKWFIAFFYGADFIGSYKIFAMLIPAVFALGFGSLLNTYFWSRGFPIYTIIFPTIAFAFNVGLNLLLIPKIGIAGAAIATSLSYILWFILLITFFFKDNKINNPNIVIPNKNDFVYFYNQLKRQFAR